VPDRQTIRPLSAHEFDALVIGKLGFEAAGLIVAERDGVPVAFVHAGFGPEQPEGPSHRLDRALGTVGMLVAEPGLDDPGLEDALMAEALAYLRGRGAQVLYAGGQYPLNPFYWGIYGGAEWAGILGDHAAFLRTVERAGYQPMSSTVLWEADLTQPEVRDPKAVVFRRQTRLQIEEDPQLGSWWDALALGYTHLHPSSSWTAPTVACSPAPPPGRWPGSTAATAAAAWA